MAGMSIAWLRAGERPVSAPFCWLGSMIAAGVLAMLPTPLPNYGLTAAGILFGAGFITAGGALMMRN
jgi:hypothetical protein